MRTLAFRLLASSLLVLGCIAPLHGEELTALNPSVQPRPDAIELLLGEKLDYDISFLWLDRLAEAHIRFEQGESPGTFRGTLVAKTRGMAAWVTQDRKQEYVSLMDRAPDGRLRSLMHEAHTIKGSGKDRQDRFKRYTFDHQKGQVRYQKLADGQQVDAMTFPMEGEPPNDILTAMFNFRAGFFGPITAGSVYRIPTFNRRGISEIVIEVLEPGAASEGRRKDFPFFPAGGMLCRVTVDRDVFETGEGALYGWFDNFGRPARGIVENVLGLGNVQGILR
jgi:hypothetical protein